MFATNGLLHRGYEQQQKSSMGIWGLQPEVGAASSGGDVVPQQLFFATLIGTCAGQIVGMVLPRLLLFKLFKVPSVPV